MTWLAWVKSLLKIGVPWIMRLDQDRETYTKPLIQPQKTGQLLTLIVIFSFF